MPEDKNMLKFEIYKSMKYNLAKALRAGFFYEAIFIEYAIIEDRCTSVLKHAGVKHIDSKGNEIKLMDKLKKMKGNPIFNQTYVRKRISFDLIEDITNWKRRRDQLIHALAKIPYDAEDVRNLALNGKLVVDSLDNRVKSVNKFFDKEYKS